jgi:tryptophan-rich sensory protein
MIFMRDREKSMGQQILALAICLAICFAAAGIGSLLTTPSINGWYAGLAKPRWTPPNWVFGPVWSTLYAMMAVAAWLVWRRGGDEVRLALILFAVQLALNVAWSGLFFALRLPGAAFAEILLLWVAIGATTLTFGRISTAAALLFVPYFAWVGFAAILNLAIWRLNA